MDSQGRRRWVDGGEGWQRGAGSAERHRARPGRMAAWGFAYPRAWPSWRCAGAWGAQAGPPCPSARRAAAAVVRCPARGSSRKSEKHVSCFEGLYCEKQGLGERGLKGNGCELQRKCLRVFQRAAAAFPSSFLPLFFRLQEACERSAGRQQ